MVARHKKYGYETATGLWNRGEKSLDQVRRARGTPALQEGRDGAKPAQLSPHRSMDIFKDALVLV